MLLHTIFYLPLAFSVLCHGSPTGPSTDANPAEASPLDTSQDSSLVDSESSQTQDLAPPVSYDSPPKIHTWLDFVTDINRAIGSTDFTLESVETTLYAPGIGGTGKEGIRTINPFFSFPSKMYRGIRIPWTRTYIPYWRRHNIESLIVRGTKKPDDTMHWIVPRTSDAPRREVKGKPLDLRQLWENSMEPERLVEMIGQSTFPEGVGKTVLIWPDQEWISTKYLGKQQTWMLESVFGNAAVYIGVMTKEMVLFRNGQYVGPVSPQQITT